MKAQIIKAITFLATAPYIAWEARQDDEIEYYRNLVEAREVREQMEKWLYEDLQKELRKEPTEKREAVITFNHFLKNIFGQGLEGVTEALHFARWLRTKINSSEKQVVQLDQLIEKTRRTVQNLENQEFDKINISESDYEVINQRQIAHEKEKTEWQKLLVKLESEMDALLAQNWVNYDLVEEEVEHNGSEYTLISTIKGLKEEKDQQISELQGKIAEFERENQRLKGELESQQNQSQAQVIQPATPPFKN
ncbi:hypothetical protein [endosymbiont GvMRE of Glomus versiforme]|uniref:hypothetical protein n=1 Tax=endosymbiont GvMRE of Glomus versiforme TaxID=2039283 RepID=UPI000EC8607D|nr:hypothetical protein [endosymbiont GvMRE of Glomus versiforme]RHZ35741.1 hypothetical protein GvMRE_Ic6g27 [endosymbiont GvMRE of Glomus versiforme]